jgi:hypothetical protein
VEYVWFDKKANRRTEESADATNSAESTDSTYTASPSKASSSVKFSLSVSVESGKHTSAGRMGARSPPKSPAPGARGTVLLDHLDPLASPRRALSAPRAPQPRTPAGATSAGYHQHDSDHAENAPLAPLKQQAARVKREKNSDMGNDILEGYIMTAGLDQKVFLWNLSGKCVGMFGAYGWEIDNEASWFKGTLP